jgi:hypothetical protein
VVVYGGVAAFGVNDWGGEAEVTVLDSVEERHLKHLDGAGAVEVVGYGLGDVGVHGCGGLRLAAVVAWALVMALVMRWEEWVMWRLDLVFFVPCGLRLLSGISRALWPGDFGCFRSCCCAAGLLLRKTAKKRRHIVAWLWAEF